MKPCISDRDSSPAKTHGTWFQGLIKLRFLMSHHRRNSVRNKVIGKKWIYSDSERSILHKQRVGHRRGQGQPWNVAWLVFIGWVISYANEWEDYSNYFGERVEISRVWGTAHSLVFWQCMELSWHLWVRHFTCWLRIKVWSCLQSWSHLVLTGLCCVLQFSSFAQLCPTLCDPMDCSTPGFPAHHQLPEFA